MIPVPNPIPEPSEFNTQCRKKGQDWLDRNPEKSGSAAPSYWREFQPQLAEAFCDRCGWTAMYIGPNGAVDHWLSKVKHRDQIYEWKNFRYTSTTINSSKQAIDNEVLDPFEVEEGWFEARIPSLELVITNQIPETHREKSEYTIKRLKLDRNQKWIDNRRQWYRDYRENGLSMDLLESYAPLVANAIRRWEDSGRELPKI